MICSSLKFPYIKEICDFVTFFFLFMISKFSSFARNTTLIKKCDTAAILRNEIFRLRVFSEGDSICVTLKNTNQNIVQYHLVFFGVCGLSEIRTMFVVSFIYFLLRLRLWKCAQSTDLVPENRSCVALFYQSSISRRARDLRNHKKEKKRDGIAAGG